MTTFPLLEEVLAEEERLDEGVVLAGLIGIGAGVVLQYLIFELLTKKQVAEFNKDRVSRGLAEKPVKALPLAAFLFTKAKAKVAQILRTFKARKELAKLESDPEVIDFLAQSMSGQSFKKGKRAQVIALLKRKSSTSTVARVEELANLIRDELVSRATKK